jgi:hypothetical protein
VRASALVLGRITGLSTGSVRGRPVVRGEFPPAQALDVVLAAAEGLLPSRTRPQSSDSSAQDGHRGLRKWMDARSRRTKCHGTSVNEIEQRVSGREYVRFSSGRLTYNRPAGNPPDLSLERNTVLSLRPRPVQLETSRQAGRSPAWPGRAQKPDRRTCRFLLRPASTRSPPHSPAPVPRGTRARAASQSAVRR